MDYHNVDNALHSDPNTAGVLLIRAYLNDTAPGYSTDPHIIVRDVASGCASPASYVLSNLQIVTDDGNVGHPWMDKTQVTDHHLYDANYLPRLCNAPVTPPNKLPWSRVRQFIPWTNPDASYIMTAVPDGLPDTLAAAGEVLRIRVRVPTTPPTPCTNGCSRSGKEQLRYMSLSFHIAEGTVLASIADQNFAQDSNGYVTLIVGTGAKVPSWVTPANGYTYLDLTSLPSYQKLSMITLRHIIPSTGFTCARPVCSLPPERRYRPGKLDGRLHAGRRLSGGGGLAAGCGPADRPGSLQCFPCRPAGNSASMWCVPDPCARNHQSGH